MLSSGNRTMQPNDIIHLPGRGVLRIAGPDAADFLQGLITNDITKAKDGAAIFAALLSPQGKILSDFFIAATAEGYFLDCPAALAESLAKRLSLYKLRSKVSIEDVSAMVRVYTSAARPARGDAMSFADPRHPALGFRAFTQEAMADAADPSAYERRRIGLLMPEGGRDYAYGDAFPHEACLDQLNGVDFRKGCYVGQEVVSRMEHRGTARTRIIGVRSGGVPLPEGGAEITAGGRPLGTLGSVDGTCGIALVRLDRLGDAVQAREPILAGGVEVIPVKPGWARYEVPMPAQSAA